ncbi:AAA family ATPase [Desulfobulbus oligotrophicus]|uniref:AAA family ATPase n=1 Tax=Desulfobulbus oligotrophicus TaxID=1909699 RepID=A0A7T5VD41_9BACT|nr:AAA family ATPase [Desulfobulbus oligotrophicus]QQG65668.1 AAA family ATPase [Desulfobulbus oligotrophicus]
MSIQPFSDLPALAQHLRDELMNKKFILLYAYNGIGKTRLSTAFKNLGKDVADEDKRDTLYFNAFTEDLFTWDNDLDNDSERVLRLNSQSRFFAGLEELEMDTRIRPLLSRYVDFDFRINTDRWEVSFSREVSDGDGHRIEDGIKISRGEENIFIWCFFLAIVQLTLDDDGNGPYNWVRYIYIDDPISSLDDQNAVAVATHLARLLKNPESKLKTVISTHHALFFNVLYNEIKRKKNRRDRFFLACDRVSNEYTLRDTGETPFFHHVAALAGLYEAEQSGELYTHHFNMLRAILEKTASFHGYDNFSACIRQGDDDVEDVLHTRLINILNHGNYSLYEPREMLAENKEHFRRILHDFINHYPFNRELFPNR